MKKDSLIKGTLILTFAAFTARILGVFQRVPLKHLLGDAGMATYGIAYNIYSVLLLVATLGIPSAISKLVSEQTALGRLENAQKIFRAAVYFSLTAGVAVTVFLWLIAEVYAVHISKDAEAALAIRALAPALLIFPLIAILRGYFQGRQMMTAGGLSQIVEQILRVVTAVGLAYILLAWGFSREWAAAGASFGGVAGSVGALAVMLYFLGKLRRYDQQAFSAGQNAGPQQQTQGAALSMRGIYGKIFKISLPISLISVTVPAIYLIDSSTVIDLLQNQVGYDTAKETLGILSGRAQSLAGIPPILAIAVSQSIVPIISSAFAQNDLPRVREQASLALRIAIILSLPVILVLCAAARPVNGFLFGDELGTAIIILLVASSFFQILMMISASILMGLGQMKMPVIYALAGIAVKLAGSFLLAPRFGIYGIIAATALCFIVIMFLNLRFLKKTVDYRIMGRKWAPLAAASVIIIAAAILLEFFCRTYVHVLSPWFSYGLQACLIAAVILPLYAVLLLKMKVLTAEDISHFPAPLKKGIQRLQKS